MDKLEALSLKYKFYKQQYVELLDAYKCMELWRKISYYAAQDEYHKREFWRKALMEVKKYMHSICDCMCNDCIQQGDCKFQDILDIINKAKGEGNE